MRHQSSPFSTPADDRRSATDSPPVGADPARRVRCALYLRVSDPNATDKYGMDSQEAESRAFVAGKGWEVVAVYREWWTSVELFERPELTKVRQAMREQAWDVLVGHRIDRLSRDVNHQGFVLSEAEHAGVAWALVTEDLDN